MPVYGNPMKATSTGYKTDFAVIISATLLDTLLFGFVGQQFYTYWTGGFKDRIYLKYKIMPDRAVLLLTLLVTRLFVNVQFTLVALQSILTWHLLFTVFVEFYGMPTPSGSLWSGPVNSLCQLFIIIFANIFLVIRIHGLTNSLVQTLAPMFFSTLAFVFGIVTVVATAWTAHSQSYIYSISVVWYTSQTLADCLISFFLVRALLNARSGLQKSDSMVKYLIRNVIQTAALATIWSIAALVSWFWLKKIVLYSVFDTTSGTVYTHAMFDTLISRTQLRDRMASTSAYVDFPSTQSQPSRFPGRVVVSREVLSHAPHDNSNFNNGTTLADKNDTIEMGKVPTGKSGVPYGF